VIHAISGVFLQPQRPSSADRASFFARDGCNAWLERNFSEPGGNDGDVISGLHLENITVLFIGCFQDTA
jgi:hypothetical protein